MVVDIIYGGTRSIFNFFNKPVTVLDLKANKGKTVKVLNQIIEAYSTKNTPPPFLKIKAGFKSKSVTIKQGDKEYEIKINKSPYPIS